MFFSNQLLCRKGPLGQTWIVATMQAKLNRKKAEQINIEEICMQILQPQVPLALRLTGILMGGIVLIYDRKVRILHEDVNDFLSKLKTAVDAKPHPDKHISLPRTKLHARFENVTITYDFDTFEDIERAMHAGTPGQVDGDMQEEEYASVTAVDPYRRLSISADSKLSSNGGFSPDIPSLFLNQVSSDDITLEERNVSDGRHQQYEDFGMDFPEDRIPLSDNLFMEDFFPEIQATVNISLDPLQQGSSPQISTGTEPETKPAEPLEHHDSEQAELKRSSPPQDGEQSLGHEPPEHDQGPAACENLRRHRVRSGGVAARRIVFDQGYTEIPASVFASWIRDTSDICKRRSKPQTGRDPEATRAQRHLDLPSVCLLSPTCIQGLEPFWPSRLAQLWERTLTGKVPPRTEGVTDHQVHRREEPFVKASSPVRVSIQGSDPSSQCLKTASQDSYPPGTDDVNAVLGGEIGADCMEADFTSAERMPEPIELRDYGSVEKLRTALQSSSTGSDDFGGNPFGRTPGRQPRYARSDRSGSPPGSGVPSLLPLDLERDPPTGGSGRFKRPRRSGSYRSTSPRHFNVSSDVDGNESNYDFVRNHQESPATSLKRFDLMEATQRETTQESMKVQVSSSLLQYLIDGFSQQGPWSVGFISLFEISEGLRRDEAARLFYQICVLSSNLFLTVKQEIPYGDILLGRGIHL